MPHDSEPTPAADDPMIPCFGIPDGERPPEERFDELWGLHAAFGDVSFPDDIAALRRQGG